MAQSAAVLGAPSNTVKQTLAWGLTCCAGLCVVGLLACGSRQPPASRPEAYGARVARCLATPRPVSDAAQDGMIGVAAGQAVLGSTPQERAAATQLSGPGSARLFQNELPRRVEPLDAFRIDRTPVTNHAYAEFVSACGKLPPDAETVTPDVWRDLAQRLGVNYTYEQIQRFVWPGAAPHSERARHPVVLVTYDDAAFYCAWRGGRLPSESEWERAARGQQGQVFPWGQRFDATQVNTRESGLLDTTAVGSFDLTSSPIGAKDMGGLVFEWTDSVFDEATHTRVVKSNSWNQHGGLSRAASRSARDETLRDIEVGFRCADSRHERRTPTVSADSL